MQKQSEPRAQPDPPPRRTLIVFAPVVLFVGLAALLGYALTTAGPSQLPSTLLGKPVPEVALGPLAGLATGGKPVPGLASADLARGDVVVVNFWASWCVPCVQEHPLLSQLKRQTGVRLVGINHKDPPPGGLRFLARLGNPFDAVGVDTNGRAAIEWGVYGMPETFVVDGAGRVAYKHIGPISAEQLATKLIPAIEAARRKAKS